MAGTECDAIEPVEEGLPIILRLDAAAEIREAYHYYKDKAEGLGLEFVRTVEACLASIERHPQMYAIVHKQVRRAVLRRFPYNLFYVVEPDRIVVIACFHASRNPKEWQRRAGG